MEAITVKKLRRVYKGHERKEGFVAAIKSLVARKKVISEALKGINFTINQGEIVGFVGPNGAGKSTTIKILSGVLYPSEGDVRVLGYTPWLERRKYVKHIGAVFGQKSQLWWDLPPADSFQLSREMYAIPAQEFEERLRTLTNLLAVEKVMYRPTRELSLGERMKCEFIMALLHNPQVLFLDEPTIGVDAIAKDEIREFLVEVNKKFRTTILLTTHDMDDIEEICERIIIIDNGTIVYDGNLEKVKKKYLTCKTVDVEFTKIKNQKEFATILSKGTVLEDRKFFKSVRFERKDVDIPSVLKQLMNAADVVDLTVHESRLEHVIKEIYKEKEK
ncbi:ATP-binding cassette domain-containing protein [Candidatus Woesearchaeota archaeon]|nr:MAG: ATP-binding cassette domain-containing protein [Candidatus Woesearchaeota archaeon]